MKKWLVGLMAAGLCAASAWATSYTLISSADAVTEGNYVIVAGQGDSAMKNVADSSSRISAGAVTVTDDIVITDPDSSYVWNLAKDGDNWVISSQTDGGTVYAAAPTKAENKSRILGAPDGDFTLWAIADSAEQGLIAVQSVKYTDRFLQKNNSGAYFCCYTGTQKDVRFFKEGSPEFSVEVEPSSEFRKESAEWVLTEGTSGAILTAVAKNGEGDIHYSWTASWTDSIEEDNEILPIPESLSLEDVPATYTVTVEATDSSETPQTATAEFSFTLVRAPQAYTVTIDGDIENGEVKLFDGETELASGDEVMEGTTVKVAATPTLRSWTVESISVTGETSGTTVAEGGEGTFEVEFEMPQENVLVAAAFKERSGDVFEKITTTDELEAGEYVITGEGSDGNEYAMLNEANTSTSTDHIKRLDDPVDASNGAIAGPADSIVWTLAQGDAGWTIHNESAGYVCYVPNMGNSANVESNASTRSTWTIAANDDGLFAVVNVGDTSRVLRYNPSQPRFACYDKPTSGKSLAFYKKTSSVFSVSLSREEDFEVTKDEVVSIAATAKNALGVVGYEWYVDGVLTDTAGDVFTIDTSVVDEDGVWHEVKCVARDGGAEEGAEPAEASVSYKVVAAPEIFTVTIAEGIENGEVTVEPTSGVAGTIITVTATPLEGYRCDGIYVNDEPLTGITFALPEGGATVSASFVESSTKTATYTVTGTNTVETTGDVPTGSVAEYASTYNQKYQLTASNSMTLLLKGYEGSTITGLTLSMRSNTSKGAGSLSVTCGDAVISSIAAAKFNTAGWHEAWSTNYVDIKPAVTSTRVDGDVAITIAATESSLYCQSFTVKYEPGEPPFTVGFDKEDGFTVPLGEPDSIRAIAQNGEGEITYSWESDTTELNGSGQELPIPATLAAGGYSVTVTANDSSDPQQTATADISFTVVAPPENYTVTVADGIENGEVKLFDGETELASGAEVLEGTVVTVVATPFEGYQLDGITVNGELLEGTTTFTVTGNSEVSATFMKTVDYATLPFLAENTPFTGPWQTPKEAGVTAEGLGTDYNNTTDGRGAKFDTTGDWLQIKFEGTPGELSYGLKGNGTSPEQVSTFDVAESATGEDGTWMPVASHKSGENLFNNVKTNFTAELKADSRFVKFAYTERVAGNVGLFDVYISSGGFSVGFVGKEDGFEVVQGTADSITAEAKNGVGEVTYAWTGDLTGEGAELAIPATLGLGEHSVTVTATDSSEPPQEATADITFTVVEAPPPPAICTVDVADGILNGTIALFVDGEELAVPAEVAKGTVVTVVATPYDGYKAGEISVNITNVLESDSFTVTEDATVYASFVESHDVRYVPVESADEFVAGEEYLIVAHKAGTFTDAMKNAADDKGTHIGVAGVSMDADGSVSTDNADIVWKIQAAKEEGQYVLFNEAGNVYAAATKNDNLAQLLAEGTNALAQWTLDLTGLPSVKIVSVSYTNRWLQRNTTSNLQYFATYTGTQTTPLLYKKAGPTVFDVTVNKTGFEVPLGSADAVTAAAKNGVEPYSYVWTSETEELNGAGALLEIPATLAAGEYTATVTATDSSEPPQTDTAEVAFTVAAPAVKYAVTVGQEIANGTIAADKDEAEAGETVTLTATPADGWKLGTFILNGDPIGGNTFEMPAGEALVSAEFVPIVKYPITVDGEIANGTIAADKDEAEAGEIVTLTATPDDGWKLGTFILNGDPIGGNTFEMPAGEALVSAEFVERTMTTYELVEAAADFVAGEEYLIVAHKADGFTSAMKNEASGDRIGLEEVDFKTETSIETDNDAIVWVIQAGAEGQYTLYNAAAGVYAAAKSDGNFAKITADPEDALAQWTLDLTALPEAKIVSASYTNRWLQRNSTANNKYFATYTGSQTTPSLYKKAGFSVGFVDKEDGFTVDEGTADSITAEAVRGVEPYSYAWTGDLEGDGATLAIPDTLEAGEYSVTVTATDSSDPQQEATADISFTVVAPTQKFTVTVADGIEGGTVEIQVDGAVVDVPATLPQGTEVKVVATPFDGYALGEVTVTGATLGEDSTFVVEGDAVVSATFAEVVDYATLPFVSAQTPYSGPWYNAELPVGMTSHGLGGDYDSADGIGAKFKDTGAWLQVKFTGTPGKLEYGIKGNGIAVTNETVPCFLVQESADGIEWKDLAVYTDENLGGTKTPASHDLSEDSRFVRFFYETKAQGNVGIYDVYIGVPGEEEPTVTVTGETTLTLGGEPDSFELALGLENYAAGEYIWAWSPATIGYVDPDTATWWWRPTETQVGETEMTFSAMDGTRTIASTTVTLTVRGAPALVIEGDEDGEVGTPVNFTVVAENVEDPSTLQLDEIAFPDASSLTIGDVVCDFPNVSFTPDVVGEYLFSFSAEGVDSELWLVKVTAEPAVTLVGGETTVALDDYFLLEFELSNYEGAFEWTVAEGPGEFAEGLYTWTPETTGTFSVTVAAVDGETAIATSDPIALTVTGETPPPEQAKIKSITVEEDKVTLEYTGDATEAWWTDDLTNDASWEKVEDALVEGGTAIVPKGEESGSTWRWRFLRLQ